MDWEGNDISQYQYYPIEGLRSICEAAFNMFPDQKLPPHKGMFYLARKIGYEIPERWKDLYLD